MEKFTQLAKNFTLPPAVTAVTNLTSGGGIKMDELSEKFQTALDPDPSFSETYDAFFFSRTPPLKPCIKVRNLQYKLLD